MKHSMEEVRIDLNNCNRCLARLGIDRRLRIEAIRDGGTAGSRRLVWSDNHIVSNRCKQGELYKVVSTLKEVLEDITNEIEEYGV